MATPELVAQEPLPEEGEVFNLNASIDPLELAAQALAKLKATGLTGVIDGPEDTTPLPDNVTVLYPVAEIIETSPGVYADNPPELKKRKVYLSLRMNEAPSPGMTIQEVARHYLPEDRADMLSVISKFSAELKRALRDHQGKIPEDMLRGVVLLAKMKKILSTEKDEETATSESINEVLNLVLRVTEPLITQLAIKLASPDNGVTWQDLVVEGQLALLQAMERFDLSKKNEVMGYCWPRINGAMLDALREKGGVIKNSRLDYERDKKLEKFEAGLLFLDEDDIRRATEARERQKTRKHVSLDHPDENDMTLLDRIADSDGREEDYFPEEDESAPLLIKLLGRLPEREQGVIAMRFGLPPYEDEHTLREVGESFGFTESRASQIVAHALERMRALARAFQTPAN